MFKRDTFQNGSIYKESRKFGDVWVFRWRELNGHGQKVHRKQVLGTVKKLPSLSAANKAAAGIRLEINNERTRHHIKMTIEDLTTHYLLKELPEDLSTAQVPKAHPTAVAYRRYLRKWIVPRWGSHCISHIEPIAVEEWLRNLELANGTKSKIRNIMSNLYNHAIRHGFIPRHENANPIRFVRQGAESDVVQTVLTHDEVWRLLEQLREPVRTMALVDAFTGLRISELLALQWQDIDFFESEINVRRAIVYGEVGKCKTVASRKPVPMHAVLASALTAHLARSAYQQPTDWAFASPWAKGKKPLTTSSLSRWHIKPAAKRAGITGKIGWHTFRRTLASLLIGNGEDVKVVQESMRHANSKETLDTYAQTTTHAKRNAQARLIAQVIPAFAAGDSMVPGVAIGSS